MRAGRSFKSALVRHLPVKPQALLTFISFIEEEHMLTLEASARSYSLDCKLHRL